jgi:pimeloyl-ACP methyl ester carboxylesterase
MDVVETLYDYSPEDVLARVGVPTWVAVAEGTSGSDQFAVLRATSLARVSELLAQPRVIRMAGAVHDVPLQWPALVAGVIRAAVEEVGVLAGNRGSR